MVLLSIKNLIYSIIDIPFYFLNRQTITIGSGSKMCFRKISFRKNCVVILGENAVIEGKIFFDRNDGKVQIGDRTFIGGGTKLICGESIVIGDDVLISWGCTIVDHDSHSTKWEYRKNDVINWIQQRKDWDRVSIEAVSIGNKSWLGFNVTVLKGVHIGEGAIIGAGSVVTKDIPAWTIAAGNPARVIRELGPDER